jgi:hypothetical protein
MLVLQEIHCSHLIIFIASISKKYGNKNFYNASYHLKVDVEPSSKMLYTQNNTSEKRQT